MWGREKRPGPVDEQRTVALLVLLLAEVRALKEVFMGAVDQFRTILAAAQVSLDDIRQDIADIKAQLPTEGGMTAAETAEILASVTDLGNKLNALDLENPAPPPPTA
jgi:hypothetical protein